MYLSWVLIGSLHCLCILWLKELRHDIWTQFFDILNCGSSVGKPKIIGFLRKKNTKVVILKQKGTRMAEDGEDWNWLEMTILRSLAICFKLHERWRSGVVITLDLFLRHSVEKCASFLPIVAFNSLMWACMNGSCGWMPCDSGTVSLWPLLGDLADWDMSSICCLSVLFFDFNSVISFSSASTYSEYNIKTTFLSTRITSFWKKDLWKRASTYFYWSQ